MDNQSQQNAINEVTHLLCQAQAVQIRTLQAGLPECIQQTTKALEENNPELAHNLWKQVVQNCQTISQLFKQTNSIMTGTPPGGRRQYANGGRGQQRNFSNPKQLNRLVRQVTESVLAAA